MEKTHVEKLQAVTRIDYDGIARELYNMIPADEKICMRLGMLPATPMRVFEDVTKAKFEKLVAPIRSFYVDTFGFDAEYLAISMKECDDYVKINSDKTRQEVARRLISIATEKGLCIV